MWGVGVLLTNAYVCYHSFHKKEGTPPGNVLSSYEFRRAIALDWMDPSEDKKAKERPKELKNTKKSPPAAPGKKRKAAAAAATSNGSSTGGSGILSATTVTDNALTPSGILGHRLSCVECHFPQKPLLAARAKCALHRWARKTKKWL